MKKSIFALLLMMAYLGTAWAYDQYEDPNKKIIKNGLLGAGVGAISAGASGGSAGKGALIGAGTNVIGGALLDSLFSSPPPQQQQVQYVQAPPQQAQYVQQQDQGYQGGNQGNVGKSSSQPKKHIYRKYDKDGNIVSEEEVWE